MTAQDPAGNRRSSAKYSVTVSSKRLVTKTATLDKRGTQFYTAGGSDDYCAGASLSLSYFRPYGLWLANTCSASYDELPDRRSACTASRCRPPSATAR